MSTNILSRLVSWYRTQRLTLDTQRERLGEWFENDDGVMVSWWPIDNRTERVHTGGGQLSILARGRGASFRVDRARQVNATRRAPRPNRTVRVTGPHRPTQCSRKSPPANAGQVRPPPPPPSTMRTNNGNNNAITTYYYYSNDRVGNDITIRCKHLMIDCLLSPAATPNANNANFGFWQMVVCTRCKLLYYVYGAWDGEIMLF